MGVLESFGKKILTVETSRRSKQLRWANGGGSGVKVGTSKLFDFDANLLRRGNDLG